MADTAHGTGSTISSGSLNSNLTYGSSRLTYDSYVVGTTEATTIRIRIKINMDINFTYHFINSSGGDYISQSFYWKSTVSSPTMTMVEGAETQSDHLSFYNPTATGSPYSSYDDNETSHASIYIFLTVPLNTTSREETIAVSLGFSTSIDASPSSARISTANFTLTIPARKSYAVSYNANGGSGTINTAYQYYAVPLTLASSGYTRNLHKLIGWAGSDGVNYKLGSTYSGNAAVTMYARWQYVYVKPKIVDPLAFRTPNDDSESIKVTFKYTQGSLDGTAIAANKHHCTVKINNGSEKTVTINSNGMSYTFNDTTYSRNSAHTVVIKIYDDTGGSSNATTVTLTVSTVRYPLDILASGLSMGVMCPAQTGWYLSVPNIAIELSTTDALYSAINSLGWVSSVASDNARDYTPT